VGVRGGSASDIGESISVSEPSSSNSGKEFSSSAALASVSVRVVKVFVGLLLPFRGLIEAAFATSDYCIL
jgi:hypothetical protein